MRAGVGTAVLVLDALSLRELPLDRGGRPSNAGLLPFASRSARSEVPTETDRFAEALGLPSRSKLYNNKAPDTFVFAGPDVYTDLLDPRLPIVSVLSVDSPRLFVWHKWPDEPLIHLHEDKKDGPAVVAAQTKKELSARWLLETGGSAAPGQAIGHHRRPRLRRRQQLLQ